MLELIVLKGTPYEIGFNHGLRLKNRISDCIDEYKKLIPLYSKKSWETCLALALAYKDTIKNFSPDMILEMQGIADGSERSFNEILLLNVQGEILFMYAAEKPTGYYGGCTSVAVVPECTQTGHMLHGQNLDFEPGHEDLLVILEIHQENKPTVLTITEPGTIGKIGMNSKGIGLTSNALGTSGTPIGLPAIIVSRAILNANNIAQAIGIIAKHQCAFALSYTISNNDGEAVAVEVALEDYDVLYPEDGICVHSNHYLSPLLMSIHHDILKRYCSSTHIRFGRAKRLFAGLKSKITVDDFKKLFTDHADYPESICFHPNPAIPLKIAQLNTVCSVIMDTTKGEMHVSHGRPCEDGYDVFQLNIEPKSTHAQKWHKERMEVN